MRVYISGPVTGLPKEEYLRAFEEAENNLQAAGHETFNPAKSHSLMPKWFTHDNYMQLCKREMEMCDAMIQLPGWEQSKGCQIEYHYAWSLNMKIYTEIPKEDDDVYKDAEA